MAERAPIRRLPIAVTIVVALMLEIAPVPDAAEAWRPDWVLLTLVFWSMRLPRSIGVGIAWLLGLVLDVAQGTLLGQHALALSAAVLVSVQFHLQLRVFPLSQLTLSVGAILALYQFILFWVSGVAGVSTTAVDFYGPVVAGTIAWPLVYFLASSVNYRRQNA